MEIDFVGDSMVRGRKESRNNQENRAGQSLSMLAQRPRLLGRLNHELLVVVVGVEAAGVITGASVGVTHVLMHGGATDPSLAFLAARLDNNLLARSMCGRLIVPTECALPLPLPLPGRN